MMFIHHFFTFPSWWGEGIAYPLIEKLAPYFCMPLKLCVPVFCFITGYFYYFQKDKSYRYSLRKITDILVSYWVVFFIFAIIASIFADYKYKLWDFVAECFAIKRPTMSFCWYVNFYIILMFLLPLIVKALSRNVHIDLFICLVVIPQIFRVIAYFIKNDIIIELINNQRYWIACVLIGYIFANYELFEKIGKLNNCIVKNKKINTILLSLLALVVPFGRYAVSTLTLEFSNLPSIGVNLDVIYSPIFIYAIVQICNAVDAKKVKIVLTTIGKYSMLMWFVSCIFYNNCKNIFQPVLYFPHNPIFVTVWGIVICMFVSFVLDKGTKKINNRKNKLFLFR